MTKEEFRKQINKIFICYKNSKPLTEAQFNTWYEWFMEHDIKGFEIIADEFISKSFIPPQSPYHIVSVALNNVIPEGVIVNVDMTITEIGELIKILTSLDNKSNVIEYLIFKLGNKREQFPGEDNEQSM